MKIKLNPAEKAEMLIAWKTGILDTDKIEALKDLEPAKRLTPKEAADYIRYLEANY